MILAGQVAVWVTYTVSGVSFLVKSAANYETFLIYLGES